MANLAKTPTKIPSTVPKEIRQALSKEILKAVKRFKLDPDIPAERELLSNKIRNVPSIKKLLPDGFRINALNNFIRQKRDKPDSNVLINLTPEGTDAGNLRRADRSDRPGQEQFSHKNAIPYLRRHKKTNQFLNEIKDLGYDDAVIEKYFYEVDKGIREVKGRIAEINRDIPKGSDQKVSYGHLNRMSKSIDSPRNLFVELLTENLDKGDKYMESPSAMMAIGNPTKEGLSWTENWKRDFLTWADKPENGGTGRLPQRGDYSDLLEQKFKSISGNQWDKLTPEDQQKAIDEVNDLIHAEEQKKGFKPEGLKGDDFRRNFDENAQRQIDEINAGYDRQRKSGDHPINTALNWMGIGAKSTLEELPISGELITAGKTAKSLGEGDFVGAAQHIVGSTKTTTEPFRSEIKSIGRDIKLDPAAQTFRDLSLKGF